MFDMTTAQEIKSKHGAYLGILFMPSLGSGYYVFFGNMTVSPLARLPAAHTPSENVKNLFCKATKRAKIFIL